MAIRVTPIIKMLDLAVPALTLGTANAAGSAETSIASDSTLLVFDTTSPAAVAASAVVGTATVSSRRDHVHVGVAALATPALTLGTANAAGAAETSIASDATLLVFDAVSPAAVAASAVVGTATVSSRRDHVHEGVTASADGVAKAWCKFDGTDAGPITNSVAFNCDATTDLGTGDYGVNFTTDFATVNYVFMGFGNAVSVTEDDAPTASRFNMKALNGSHAKEDAGRMYAFAIGTQ